MADLEKAFEEVDKLIAESRKKGQEEGVYEDMGYEHAPELSKIISACALSFAEECELHDYFSQQCEQLNDGING